MVLSHVCLQSCFPLMSTALMTGSFRGLEKCLINTCVWFVFVLSGVPCSDNFSVFSIPELRNVKVIRGWLFSQEVVGDDLTTLAYCLLVSTRYNCQEYLKYYVFTWFRALVTTGNAYIYNMSCFVDRSFNRLEKGK